MDAGTISELLSLLKPGENPRDKLPGHRERGPKRFWYGYREIGAVLGCSVGAVKAMIGRGELDPADLGSIARAVAYRAAKAGLKGG